MTGTMDDEVRHTLHPKYRASPDLASRILALFPSDSATELTRQAIVKSLALGPTQANEASAALKSLVAEGRLVAETDFGNSGTVYYLPRVIDTVEVAKVGDDIAKIVADIRRIVDGHCAEEITPSQAILAARRTALIDEAVRMVKAEREYQVLDMVEANDHGTSGPYVEILWPVTIAAIRSEFNNLVQERA